MDNDISLVLPVILLLMLIGLALRLPSPLVLAGGALLGAFLGQIMGFYDLVLMGDLASEVESVLDNETLLAIPLLVLSGTLFEKTRHFAALRARLRGGWGAIADLLLAVCGGGGRTSDIFVILIERAAPSAAFLVLLGDLIDRAYLAANLPQGQNDLIVDHTPLLMMAMGLPVLLLTLARGLSGGGASSSVSTDEVWGEPSRFWLVIPVALFVPGLILSGLASPAEAGAVGVGLSLLLMAACRDLGIARLGSVLDRALVRAAVPFVTLIAGQCFHLVFSGIGEASLTQSLLTPFAGLHGLALLLPVCLALVLLGSLIEPLALAVLFLPMIGPYLLEHGVTPIQIGIAFAMAPLGIQYLQVGLLHRVIMPLAQLSILTIALFVPVQVEPFSTPASGFEEASPQETEEGGFTPEDSSDSPDGKDDDNKEFAPPRDGE
jgi:hypothetical protein